MLQNNMCQPKSELFVLPCIDLQEVGGWGQRKQVALKATQCDTIYVFKKLIFYVRMYICKSIEKVWNLKY